MRTGATLALLAGVLLPALSAPALAWSFGRREAPPPTPCVLDKCLAGGAATPAPAGTPGTGFDFYVLALSWSPGFCSTGGADRSPDQCAPGRDLGFVVHGLWPQNARGYPSNCDAGGTRAPSRAVIDGVRDLYPDPGLARHEWRTHGTCTGLSPTAYFAAVRQARTAVTVPPAFEAPRVEQEIAPAAIARAFVDANRGLRPDALAVTCRRGTLAEVRVCLTRDLRGFQSCPAVARAGCRTQSVTVPPPG